MAELWYRLTKIPDLTLNKYASLEGNGVDGVLEKHIAFLRQLNRKGIVSSLSFHLFYLYLAPEDPAKDSPGHRLQIYLMIQGEKEALNNMGALISASPLSDFYPLKTEKEGKMMIPCDLESALVHAGIDMPVFDTCAVLTKTETLLPSSTGDGEEYYMIRDWDMNDDGRLYNMSKIMEALGRTVLYRVDLYPVERSVSLREALRKPMNILRKRQEDRGVGARRDYEGKDVLDNYEDLIEKYDSSPHFIANIMVFSDGRENATAVLDAAGSEALLKGKYTISTFHAVFEPFSFLRNTVDSLENVREQMILRKGRPGMLVNREDTSGINLNYLPTLFSMEEIAPFFRLPALYDGEVIQISKETAPDAVDKNGSLFLGKDRNGYDVFFPLKLLPKHAFVSGVPGSGKTNTMHHITSSLWKDHHIPFLVLEPAKQEYRALANDPGMKDLWVFSPNADMSFPLHINPFEMPEGTLVAEHIRRLCSVFEGAFPLEPPMPFLLDTAIEAVYREAGWIPEHIYTGRETKEDGHTKRPLPTMSMLYRRLEEELNSTNYSDEVRGNLESALKVRIGSLLRREMGDVFDVPESTLKPERWLEVPAVIELESMGSGPANFLTLMLCSLIRETLKAHPKFDGDIRHVIFIEEAHNLIGPESEEQAGADADPKQAATAFVVKMLAEVRALKEGIVIADQLPTVMAQEVLKNTGLKIGLRITSADDRSLLGSTMAASGMQLEEMSTFAIGEALIFYEKLMRPFTMRIKEWWGELEDSQQKEAMVSPKNDGDLRIALKNRVTYRESNLRSIMLTGKKYRWMLDDKEKKRKEIELLFSRVQESMRQYNQLYQVLYEAELGQRTMEETEKIEKNAQLHLLEENLYKWLKGFRKNLMEMLEQMQFITNWMEALERLKNGRWKRFGAEDEQLKEVAKLQFSMHKRASEMHSFLNRIIKELEKMKNIALIQVLKEEGMGDLSKEIMAEMEKCDLIADGNRAEIEEQQQRTLNLLAAERASLD